MSGKSLTKWVPGPGELSRRVPAKDIKSGLLFRPFYVQEGTEALLFQKGKYVGRLDSGEQEIDGSLRKLFLGNEHSEMYLIRSGGFDVDLGPIECNSGDGYAMSFALRLRLFVDEPETAFREFLQGRDTKDGERTISTNELGDSLLVSARSPVQSGVQKHLGRELAENANDALTAAVAHLGESSLAERIAALGFKIDGGPVLAVEDVGAVAEVLEEAQNAALIKSKEMIAASIEANRHKISTEAHDRADEDTARAYRRELLNLGHTQAIEIAKARHREEIRDVERSGDIKDAETARKVDKEHADAKEYRDTLAEERKRREREDKMDTYERMKRLKAELASGRSVEELIAMGLGEADVLAELRKTDIYKDMTAEQIREARRNREGS